MVKYLIKRFTFVILILVLIVLCSCSNGVLDTNKISLEKYGIRDSELDISKLSYDDLVKENNIDGVVLVVKSSCDYCQPFMKRINDFYNKNKIIKKMYALESDELTIEQKVDLADKYMLTSVPSILVFEKGEFRSLDVGNISDDMLEKIIG